MAVKKTAKPVTTAKARKTSKKKVIAKGERDVGAVGKTGKPEAAKKLASSRTSRVSATPNVAATKVAAVREKKEKSSPLIEFKLKAPDAHTVFLAGDFNGWLLDRDKMNKDKDGTWRKELPLSPGRHEYQFVVDGNWWTDPDNPERAWNPFGTQNSIRKI